MSELESIMRRDRHYCAVCLKPIQFGRVGERTAAGTPVLAVCHGRQTRTVFTDADVEDLLRLWHFVDDEGQPWKSPAELRREELQREVEF